MSETNDRPAERDLRQTAFFGTYFDRDGVLRLSRWADIIAWIVLTVYLLSWILSILLFFAQYYNGLYMDKGMTLLNVFNMFAPYLQQPLPGLFYFFGLQAVSKGLLIFLDMEDNTRRAARNNK
jgi:hypothetical protein